ncbi:hypothetical protein [Arthrobacter sp. SLBN-112]
MALHNWQDVLPDAGHQDGVGRLLGDEPFQVPFPGRPLGFDDLGTE